MAQREKKDAKFWDKMAEGYSKSPISDVDTYQKKLDITREYFASKSTTSVFEFGCGTGSTALLHAPHVKHVYATDLSPKMIEIARRKAAEQGIGNVDFEVAGVGGIDAGNANHRDNYDVVLGLNVLHLVPDRDEVISKVHAMLKPGGVFVSSTACAADMGVVVGTALKWFAPLATRLGLMPQFHSFTAAELKGDMTRAGFTIEREFQPSRDKALFLVAQKK